MKKYLLSREGEEWAYSFTAPKLTEFLESAPKGVNWIIKTVDESQIIDPRRLETYAVASWDEHRLGGDV